ncbi:hypothetical protein AVEN_205595-1 [Araneus ventricosus]|uniref:Uncharacterized protein n=1 Tax=Araneus ventricosus TaxID=182803 RepID=A0A4Y2FA83_ARAVE|nr:hypothetical protein AVEN_205595-1 [Araneus ventricosus]
MDGDLLNVVLILAELSQITTIFTAPVETPHNNILRRNKNPSPFTSLPLGKHISPSETAQNHVSAPVGRPAWNIAARTVHRPSLYTLNPIRDSVDVSHGQDPSRLPSIFVDYKPNG